ncbi:MAG: hypothetical protein ACLP1X_08755 [Polyangiaceae bacterium]
MRLSLLAFALAACGGSTVPANSSPPSQPSQESAGPTPITAAASTSPPPVAASAETYDDPGEAQDPATLTPILTKGSKPTFPKATVGEHECWQTVSPSGAARKDYDTIITRCGSATGAIEYVKPALGKLHHKLDKRDTFIVPILGGLCYRFFGVADSTIQDIDILIERPGGALVGEDKTNGPVAIIESEKAWCMDKDGVYNFLVEIDGEGQGNYVFGIWARPKP